jgi:hypothetical protein
MWATIGAMTAIAQIASKIAEPSGNHASDSR